MYHLLLTFTLVFGLSSVTSAQVVRTPEGEVEFIGLERWTIPMIQDSMAVHAPGEPLGQCAAVLRRLGFVSAEALSTEAADGQQRTIVTVVEPHRAARIRLRTLSGDSLPDVPAWAEGIALFNEHNLAFQSAIQWRRIALQRDSVALAQVRPWFGERIAAMEEVWQFLDQHRSPADLEQALHALAADRNGTNAMVAAAILTNFPEEPRALWALVDAQRDSREYVAATASQAMRGLLVGEERVVDWQPATASLRALLEGTNVFVLNELLAALTSTRISPELAPVLLRDGGADLVLARLRTQHEGTRRVARAFLVQVSGADHGDDPSAWRAWLRSQ